MSATDPPLRVLHLTAGSDAGGVSRYLHELARGSVDRGCQVAIAGERGAWHELFADSPAQWLEQPLKGNLLALHRAARALRRQRWDIVHAHSRRAALVGRRIARAQRIPLLFTLHLTGIPLRGLWRWLSDFGDHCHAPSSAARQWLIDSAGVAPARITVIPHGLDESRFPVADAAARLRARAQLQLPADAPVAAYVGRFDVPKNEHWLLDLAEQSRPWLPDLRLLLVGEGPHEAELRRSLAERGLDERVQILSYRAPQPIYAAIDLLLLPSAQEGFSYVCAEAMATGRAVLRTQTAGAAEMIVPGRTGQTTPIEREAFLTTAQQMLADRPRLHAMGAAAATHVRAHLSLCLQLERTVSLYRQLIAAHAPRRRPQPSGSRA